MLQGLPPPHRPTTAAVSGLAAADLRGLRHHHRVGREIRQRAVPIPSLVELYGLRQSSTGISASQQPNTVWKATSCEVLLLDGPSDFKHLPPPPPPPRDAATHCMSELERPLHELNQAVFLQETMPAILDRELQHRERGTNPSLDLLLGLEGGHQGSLNRVCPTPARGSYVLRGCSL